MLSDSDLVNLKLDRASLRARFDRDRSEMTPAEQRLVDRWKQRAQGGRDFNLLHYKVFLAIDRALDSDFYQTTQTLMGLLKDLADTKDQEAAVSVVNTWGMPHLLTPDIDPKTGLATGKKILSLPALCQVVVSLARSYTQNRVARIVNERTSVPLFKYEPAFATDENRLACEVLTQAVDQISRNFGYAHILAQAVQAAVSYGQQFMFIGEEWCSKRGREGLRYVLPHPNRTYYDTAFPTATLNTETGVRYCGYWEVTNYGTMRTQSGYWNRDRIRMSYKTMDTELSVYLQTTGACSLAHWPTAAPGAFVSQLDREAGNELNFLTSAQDDYPVFKTEHFELVNPRLDFDDPTMPDQDYWFRVVLASDDTPLYVACLPGRPATVVQYEPSDNRVIQSGLTLQVLPYQDHVTNLMTQGILSIKQNLSNLNLVDADAVNENEFKSLVANNNEALYRKLNFMFFSSREMAKRGAAPNAFVFPNRFTPQDIGGHLTMIQQLLSILERVTGISAQEIGSFASHEQSAEEIRMIHSSTSQRYEFVAANVDRAIEAWKAQLYQFWTAKGKADSLAMVSPELIPMAQEAGYLIKGQGPKGALIQVPAGRIRVESFVAQRDGPNRVSWTEIGSSMLQLLTTVSASPDIMAASGGKFIKLLNMAFEALGMPRGFRLDEPPEATPDIQGYITQQLQAFAEQTKGFVREELQALLTTLASNAPVTQAPAMEPAAPPMGPEVPMGAPMPMGAPPMV